MHMRQARRWLCLLVLAPLVGSPNLWAQTSGATAPEVTQFEPVDITDLVNLHTGDFQYAIPVMAIPSAPGGSYPLSLNYHAGIRYDQEASWVGLGWNLSPGSIARMVRQLPDDYHAERIRTYNDFGVIYSREVGFSINGVRAGVSWDNTGGFGGYLGYANVTLNYYRSGNGDVNWAVGVGLAQLEFGNLGINAGIQIGSGGVDGNISASYAKGPLSFGADWSSKSGVSASASLSSGLTGVSLSSDGTLGISNFSGFSAFSHASFDSGTRTQTSGFSLNAFISLKFQKTRTTQTEYQGAFGYIHTDKVAGSAFAQDFLNANQFPGGGANPLAYDGALEDFDIPLNEPEAPSYLDTQRFLNLDFHIQDYEQSNARRDDEYSDRAALESDFAATSFDLFNVAAQGLNAVARPMMSQRGFLRPTNKLLAHRFTAEDSWRMHPYRSFLDRIRDGNSPFNAYHGWVSSNPEAPSNQQPRYWQGFQTAVEDNMVFLNDQGLVETHPMLANGLQADHFSHGIQHRANRIRYETDPQTKRIVRIIVTRANGVRYIFGLHKPGKITYGAAPKVSEKHFSKSAESTNAPSAQDQWSSSDLPPYAYAWHIAAIEAPSYVDRGQPGYDQADFGTYINFQYGMASANYYFSTPYQHGPVCETTFDQLPPQEWVYTGYDDITEKHQYQHHCGTKQIHVPLFAETPTHVASFSYSHRADALSADFELNNLHQGARYRMNRDVQLVESTLATQIIQSQGGVKEQVLLFPKGTAEKFGSQISTKVRYLPCGGESPFTLTYHATLYGANQEGDVFIVNTDYQTPPPLGGCEDSTNYLFLLEPYSSPAKLDRIRLYDKSQIGSDWMMPMGSALFNLNPDNLFANNRYETQVDFTYSHGNGQDMPNHLHAIKDDLTLGQTTGFDPSTIPDGRMLLKRISFFAANGIPANDYEFEYFENLPTTYQTPYLKDPWGFYSPGSTVHQSKISTETMTQTLWPEPGYQNLTYPKQAAWSLKKIRTPVGAEIGLVYEQDRYSYVQDILAVQRTDPNYWRGVGNSVLRLEASEIDDLIRTDPTSFDTIDNIVAMFRGAGQTNYTFNLTPGGTSHSTFWDRHVLVSFSFQSNQSCGQFSNKRFTLPIDRLSPTSYQFSDHLALRAMISWMLAEEDNPTAGGLSWMEVKLIPAELLASGKLSPLSKITNPTAPLGITGEYGGGLRVSRLIMKADDQTFETRYDYRFPNKNLESGMLFVDPPNSNNSACNNPTISRETNPYYNMPGSEVTYEFVTVKNYGNGNQLQGEMRYQFYGPHDEDAEQAGAQNGQFINSNNVVVTTYNSGFTEISEAQIMESPQYKYNGDGNWEFGTKPTKFTLVADERRQIVNNTALFGNLRRQSTLDELGRKITETETLYQPNFNWTNPSEGPWLKAFEVANHQISEKAPGTYAHRAASGVHTDKTMALLAGYFGYVDDLTSTPIRKYHKYDFKFLTLEEIYNQYRTSQTITKGYHYPNNTDTQPSRILTVTNEALAYDYYTGKPVFTRSMMADGGGEKVWSYKLDIPAHQIFGNGEMTAKNLLTQSGFSLSALYRESHPNPPQVSDIISSLATGGAQVLGSNLEHWFNRPYSSGSESAWVSNAHYGFVQNTHKTSDAWRTLPINNSKGAGLLHLQSPVNPAPDSGFWLAAAQSTRFDDRLHVLESHDLLGNFSAAAYIQNNRLVAATFTNAQLSQVYYQGFEDEPEGASIETTINFKESKRSTAFLDNYQRVYAGKQSFKGPQFQVSLAGLSNAYSGIVNDPRNAFWVSCYVKGSNQVTINGHAITSLSQTRSSANERVTPVDNGWTLVRYRLTSLPTMLTISLNASAFLDEITVYPASHGSLGQADQKTDASVTLFGYNPKTLKVNSITDPRGLTIRYEYDQRGHLYRVYNPRGEVKTEHFRSYYHEKLHGNAIEFDE